VQVLALRKEWWGYLGTKRYVLVRKERERRAQAPLVRVLNIEADLRAERVQCCEDWILRIQKQLDQILQDRIDRLVEHDGA
jgi:hypothetical protein